MAISKDIVNHLHNTGFAGFNLKELDENLYNKLSDEIGEGPHLLNHNLKLVRTKWLQDWDMEVDEEWLFGSADHNKEHWEQFEHEPGIRRLECTVRYDDLQECIDFSDRVQSIDKIELQQLWCFEIGAPVPEISESIMNIFSKIIDTFYNKDLDAKATTYELTWYRKNGIIFSHRDVWDGALPDLLKLCSILIYLNKDYDESQQGQLYVDHDKYVVYPEFGNVAIIDYSTYALEHRVEPPTTDYGRYGVLSFIDVDKVKNKSSLV